MQQLAYFKQLKAVVIPLHCSEMIEETRLALKTTEIPVITVEKNNFEEQAMQAIEKYEVNTGLVVTFSFIIPRSVFSLPVNGFFNVHPGLLPAYRGADPVFYQVKNREKFAGVTVHKINEGIDTGEIVLQEKIVLSPHDTYGQLAEKLSWVAVKSVATVVNILCMGFHVHSKPQDETKACYYKKQSQHEIAINWQLMDADGIIALINACNPHNKGAASKINNKIIRLLKAEKYDDDTEPQQPAGTIVSIDNNCLDVAVIKGKLLRINFLYVDEGFLPPSFLIQCGITTGMAFENIF